jgi:hypothetical protein
MIWYGMVLDVMGWYEIVCDCMGSMRWYGMV